MLVDTDLIKKIFLGTLFYLSLSLHLYVSNEGQKYITVVFIEHMQRDRY